MLSFADRLKELRKLKGATQKQVFSAIGVSERSYQNFEYGTFNPVHNNIIKLADFFEVSIDYLLGRTDNPEIYYKINEDSIPSIIDRLKELRKSKKATQEQVSAAIGISRKNYQSFEYGEVNPSYNNIIKLADFFEVSTDYLLGRTDNPKMNL